jgi:uncharacterized protein (TIGR03067 family)
MRRSILAVLVLGLVVAADDAKDDAKKEQESLQGVWKIVRQETNGVAASDDETKKFEFIVKGDQYTLKQDGTVIEEGSIKVEPGKKPKTIDFKITKGNDAGKTQVGIYEMDKDIFKLCVAMPGKEDRPKEISAKEGSRNLLFVLKKAK